MIGSYVAENSVNFCALYCQGRANIIERVLVWAQCLTNVRVVAEKGLSTRVRIGAGIPGSDATFGVFLDSG